MNEDPDTRRGFLSYSQDSVFADIFLMIGKPAFEEAMREEMQQAEDDVPERVRSWIPIGTGHTFVQAEPEQTARRGRRTGLDRPDDQRITRLGLGSRLSIEGGSHRALSRCFRRHQVFPNNRA